MNPPKSKMTALLIAILLGPLGFDRFYLGYTGMGLLKLFTVGGLGIIWIMDIIKIANGSMKSADGQDLIS